ncbi:Na+/proline symporter [Salinisphaera orenii]|uniref:Na+/proline symporter n=1 Tax=Salinisphaera orenii YIM 95161 TaxID=1051139 RepID=A0A423Q2R8_9GAMM|nr:Na+/proline symporter [Salinisphaera halophila]ROO32956.1 hypothetical protein SAHL_04640 [Salinisphaera halophila YIM 95161]
MQWLLIAPWLVLFAYCALVLAMSPRRVGPRAFFDGGSERGVPPGPLLLGVSAAISWVMAKSLDNAMNLSAAFGLWGGLAYAAYWLAFIVVAIAVYYLRTRGGFTSLAEFLTCKYGGFAAKMFLAVIAIRLFNEVWSNTKVTAQFFGPEGSAGYWSAAGIVTAVTAFYSWRGGLRSSILTDAMQMLLIAVLLVATLAVLGPGLLSHGVPRVGAGVTPAMQAGGLTFLALALVQVLSYGFHDPVLTDRAFISPPRSMLLGFVLAAVFGGGLIALFSVVGLYALAVGVETGTSVAVAVPAAIGVWMSLLFNAVMLTSAGSTLDSTFCATAKFASRDWPGRSRETPDMPQLRFGRRALIAIALLGNIPLLSLYIDGVGPAVIAATTISGTAIMGLAPIFLLAWIRSAGALSFHLALWPGVFIGVLLVLQDFAGLAVIPDALAIGSGRYAQTLGINVWGLLLCSAGYLLGAVLRAGAPLPAPAGRGSA